MSNALCPKCQDPNEWDGVTCGVCKFDVRIPWTLKSSSDDGITAESAYAYSDDVYYGVRMNVNIHTYPSTSVVMTPHEALKLSVAIATAAMAAIKENEANAETERQANLPPF